MLGVGDAGRMLAYLRDRRTARLEDSPAKDRKVQLALDIYTATSPPSSLVLPTDDEEVTDATYAEHYNLASAMRRPDVSEEENKNAASSLKLISFECLKKSTAESFVFVREDVATAYEPQASATAENNNNSSGQAAPASLLRAMFPVKLVQLRMFIQHPNKRLPDQVAVAVPEDCTVDKVVELTKKAYSEQFKSAAAGVVDRQWIIRQAEEDGTVEDDDPPLDPTKTIKKMGTSFGVEYTREDAIMADSRVVAKLVKINLPNCGSQTMMYDPSMMVSALLRKFCEKDSHLYYTPAEYAFTTDNKDEIPGDMTMRDLETGQGTLTLRLTKRQAEVEDTARVEKSYSVVKLKKFLHQERTITIAHDIIRNESKAANKDTKKPQRMIRDVKFAALVDKKPRLFHLQFKNEAKVYTYKAQSEAEAREMVSKIQWNMNKVASSAN